MEQLTSTRGILALAICLFHIKSFLEPYLPNFAMNIVSHSYIAVDFFFTLSGFILSWKYTSDFHQYSQNKHIKFIFNRITRIFPLHIFFTLCYAAIPLALTITGRETLSNAFSGQYSLTELCRSLFLVQNWFPDQTVAWNLPSWSISVEFAIYLATPFALYLINKPYAKGIFSVLTIGLYFFYANTYASSNIGSVFLGHESIHRGIVGFCFGILVFLLLDKIGVSVGMIGLAMTVYLSINSTVPESYLVNPAATFALIALCKLPDTIEKAASWAPLVYLGEISYSIYLSHYLIRDVLNMALLDGDGVAPVWWILLYLTLVIAISSLTYKYIEKRCQTWLRNLYKRPNLTIAPQG